MSIKLRNILLASALLPIATWAQNVDRSKYPDFSAELNPDPQLMHPRKVKGKAEAVRPDHVNNAESRHFPPVFYQAGGSCGSASRICYMFSHELNSFRDLDGKDPKNYYPSHFVWLLTNGNSGKDDFVQFVGVPSAASYGGQTTQSSLVVRMPFSKTLAGCLATTSGMRACSTACLNPPTSQKVWEPKKDVRL